MKYCAFGLINKNPVGPICVKISLRVEYGMFWPGKKKTSNGKREQQRRAYCHRRVGSKVQSVGGLHNVYYKGKEVEIICYLWKLNSTF